MQINPIFTVAMEKALLFTSSFNAFFFFLFFSFSTSNRFWYSTQKKKFSVIFILYHFYIYLEMIDNDED